MLNYTISILYTKQWEKSRSIKLRLFGIIYTMIKFLYKNILKPILFLFSADKVHVFFLKIGNCMGRFSIKRWFIDKIFKYENKILSQKVLDIDFTNPVGLAAGFDYDADLIQILPSIGFGFNTIGTITNLPYKGNPSPMLGRLPKSKSLLVNKGFKNEGIDKVLDKVKTVISRVARGAGNRIPLGISIGSTNKVYKDMNEMLDDVYLAFEKVLKTDYFDYYELNISCPNLINFENLKEKFDNPHGLVLLLDKLSTFSFNCPVFIKMYLEKDIAETLALTEVASNYDFIKGFIFSNLVKDRTNITFDKDEIEKAGIGSFSGKPTEQMTNVLISAIYEKYRDRFVIIGCGGIFDGKDAYEKIKRGASLVQMITGMIYEGPGVIGDINKELAGLLKKDGYKNISEAIGKYHK